MTAFDVLQSIFGNSLAPGELDDALGRNADLATILTVLYASSGFAGFVPRATGASSCVDFQTVCSWKVVLFLVHPGSPMAHLGMDISSLAEDTEVVRIRASASPALGMGQGEMDEDEFPALGSTRPIRSQQPSTTVHGRSEQKPLRATSGRKPASNTAIDVHAQPQWSAITSDHSPPAHTTPARIAREPTDNGEHE